MPKWIKFLMTSYREKCINKGIDFMTKVSYYKCKLVITNKH